MVDANLQIRVTAKDDASGSLRSVSSSLQRIGEVAAGIGLARVASDVLGLGKNALTAGIGFNAMKEQATVAFTTMLGSGKRAQSFLNDLQTFAAKTPFEFPELVTAAQRMQAMGFTSAQVLPTLTSVGDAVAAMGGNATNIDFVVRALGQMQAKGKVMAQEMLQLTEQGIPAWKYLAEAIGTDVGGAMQKVEKEGVDAGRALKAITEGINRDFGGMMEKQSHTFAGLLSNLKDMFGQAQGRVMTPFFEFAKTEMEKLVGAMGSDKWNNSLDLLELKFYDIAVAIENATANVGRLIGGIDSLGGLISGGAIKGIAGAVGRQLDPLGLGVRLFGSNAESGTNALEGMSGLEMGRQQLLAKTQFNRRKSAGELSAAELEEEMMADAADKLEESLARAKETAEQTTTSFDTMGKTLGTVQDALQGMLGTLRGAASALFGSPTREQAGLQYQLDLLGPGPRSGPTRPTRPSFGGQGANTPEERAALSRYNQELAQFSYDSQKEGIQNRMDDLEREHKLMQDRLQLADKTLLTEGELAKSAAALTVKTSELTGQIRDAAKALNVSLIPGFDDAMNAGQDLARTLREDTDPAFRDAAGQVRSWTAAMGDFMSHLTRPGTGTDLSTARMAGAG